VPIRIAAASFVAAIGADVVAHLLSQPAVEEAAHLAILVAMVAVLLAVVTGANTRQAPERQGDRHALR
jgi:uncharacterized membrane protein